MSISLLKKFVVCIALLGVGSASRAAQAGTLGYDLPTAIQGGNLRSSDYGGGVGSLFEVSAENLQISKLGFAATRLSATLDEPATVPAGSSITVTLYEFNAVNSQASIVKGSIVFTAGTASVEAYQSASISSSWDNQPPIVDNAYAYLWMSTLPEPILLENGKRYIIAATGFSADLRYVRLLNGGDIAAPGITHINNRWTSPGLVVPTNVETFDWSFHGGPVFEFSVVPEPSSSLLGGGVVFLALARRKLFGRR